VASISTEPHGSLVRERYPKSASGLDLPNLFSSWSRQYGLWRKALQKLRCPFRSMVAGRNVLRTRGRYRVSGLTVADRWPRGGIEYVPTTCATGSVVPSENNETSPTERLAAFIGDGNDGFVRDGPS
jgi:hypothetical protein